MAGLLPNENINVDLPLPPALRRSCSKRNKRVAFCDIPPKQTMSEAMSDRPGRGYRSLWYTCCVWTCLAVFIVLVIALIIGLVSMSLLRATVPAIAVNALSFPQLQISSSSKQKLLTADVNMTFEVTNNNKRAVLNIHPLTIDVSYENLNIGRAKTRGFSLKTQKPYTMNTYTSVVKRNVDDSNTEQFETNIRAKQLVVDIELTGSMGISYGRLTLNGLPMTVKCEGLQQAVFSSGGGPKCKVKLFSFG
ncbi:hypothetical protein JRO89_XS09G0010900 [Xanthoceras sorbifolium]|uniref:Late embryogenesis abundant protein LEA-2 subgroup domain-containing protein n=1 Tax=Xanthoceras sorbifolium TaxID=99658 RepID=A0ABQ8HK37_9ROSI|nr:hypothetical protein JRO89_XS09G0010900 [Xanthoceras sorbifolium]